MGIKLLTPVQYEPTLEELNAVRPLELSDEVGISIDMVALDAGDEADKSSIIGRFMRCTQHGAILANSNVKYDNVEAVVFGFDRNSNPGHTQFSQKVFGVVVDIETSWSASSPTWSDSTGSIVYQLLSLTQPVYIPMVGDGFWLAWINGGDTSITGKAYGIYD